MLGILGVGGLGFYRFRKFLILFLIVSLEETVYFEFGFLESITYHYIPLHIPLHTITHPITLLSETDNVGYELSTASIANTTSV